MEWTLIKEGILYREFITLLNGVEILNRHLKAVEGYSIYELTEDKPIYSKLIYLGVGANINNYVGILDSDIPKEEND